MSYAHDIILIAVGVALVIVLNLLVAELGLPCQ